jgi:hypothetical protein
VPAEPAEGTHLVDHEKDRRPTVRHVGELRRRPAVV